MARSHAVVHSQIFLCPAYAEKVFALFMKSFARRYTFKSEGDTHMDGDLSVTLYVHEVVRFPST